MASQVPRTSALNAKQRVVGAVATVLMAVVVDGRLVAAAGAPGGDGVRLQPVTGAAGGLVRDLATGAFGLL